MKLKYEFALREIAGEFVLVPMGSGALDFSGMVSTNETGAAICRELQADTTREAVVQALCREFQVEEATAAGDVDEFLAMLRKAGLLEE